MASPDTHSAGKTSTGAVSKKIFELLLLLGQKQEKYKTDCVPPVLL
jgi:hypothetical protein